jgi:hypothetical protein
MNETILEAIDQERKRQIEQWGGPGHDDTHSPVDWIRLINEQTIRIRTDNIYERMIKIAALGIAAAESEQRKANG